MEKITQEEFNGIKWHRNNSFIWDAIRALTPMEGMRTPCVWKHQPHVVNEQRRGTACYGVGNLANIRKVTGFKLSARCKDGTFYVFRYE